MTRLLKARDVAELLGLEMATVLDRFEAGDIPGYRLYGRKGGPVRFRESEIHEWLETSCRPVMLPGDHENGGPRSRRARPAPGRSVPDASRILRPVRE